MTYLGPLRSYPPRHMMSISDDLVDSSMGDAAWRELLVNDDVREKVNAWLGAEKLKTPYELTLRHCIPESTVTDKLPDEIWKLSCRLFNDWMIDFALNHKLSRDDLDEIIPNDLDEDDIPLELRNINRVLHWINHIRLLFWYEMALEPFFGAQKSF